MKIIKYEDIKGLATNKIEMLILDNIGVKCLIKRSDNKLLIMCQSYRSCFNIMEKIRYDFDYSVHKKGNYYLLEI
tara:strand:- start:191 stop:415 length:225 start_codon:yes stop_codon:yes gene_type:complete